MERDFFGLSSKNGAGITAKDDAANKTKDPVRSSGMQWSFSNKASARPQFLSFKTAPEDGPKKTILDPLASSGYMTTFDSNQKPFSSVFQKNLSMGKQAGNNHGVTLYPLQCSDAHLASRPEARKFSVSNQSNQVSPVLQSNLVTTAPNMVSSTTKPQPLGSKSSSGTPVSVLPSIGSVVGFTDLRNCSKSTGTHTQLTIFYAGSVCVYDDISPEKAQAIMLLAGNGSAPSQNKTVPTTKLQPAISLPSKDDGFILSQSYPSSVPSPLLVTSLAGSQPVGGSSSNNGISMRPVGASTTPTNHLESPKVVASVGSAPKKMVQTVGLPQARKASLARFLEKRKERVMTTSPYYMSKKSPECSTPGSDAVSFSINSSGSCPLPAVN